MRLQKKWAVLAAMLFGFVFFVSTTDASAQVGLKQQAQKKANGFVKIDANKDGKISQDEYLSYAKAQFEKKDANKDGKLQKEECKQFARFNADGKDAVSADEFIKAHEGMFAKKDANKDGFLSKDEFEKAAKSAVKKRKCGDGKCGGGK